MGYQRVKAAHAIAAMLLLLSMSQVAQACPGNLASWYDYARPRRTSNGERFNSMGFTAAHRTLPFGTLVQVTRGSKSVVVRITDRGPVDLCRAIDLTRGAARILGMERDGVSRVRVEVLAAMPEYP